MNTHKYRGSVSNKKKRAVRTIQRDTSFALSSGEGRSRQQVSEFSIERKLRLPKGGAFSNTRIGRLMLQAKELDDLRVALVTPKESHRVLNRNRDGSWKELSDDLQAVIDDRPRRLQGRIGRASMFDLGEDGWTVGVAFKDMKPQLDGDREALLLPYSNRLASRTPHLPVFDGLDRAEATAQATLLNTALPEVQEVQLGKPQIMTSGDVV